MSVNKWEPLEANVSSSVVSAILCFQIIDGLGLLITSVIYLSSDYRSLANLHCTLTIPTAMKIKIVF